MTPADLKVIEAACARRQHPIYYDGKNSSPPPLFYRGQHLIVEILVASDGHLARFRIPALLNLYDARDPHAFARKLLELNDQNKRLQFGCDPRDGAISVNVEVFVPDTPWTVRQVQ